MLAAAFVAREDSNVQDVGPQRYSNLGRVGLRWRGGQSFGVGGGCSAGRSLCIVALLVLPRTIRTPGRLSIGRRQHLLCKKNLHSAVGQSPETVKPAPDSHRNPQSSANGRARIARWMNAQLELMNRKFSPVSFPSRRQPRRTTEHLPKGGGGIVEYGERNCGWLVPEAGCWRKLGDSLDGLAVL